MNPYEHDEEMARILLSLRYPQSNAPLIITSSPPPAMSFPPPLEMSSYPPPLEMPSYDMPPPLDRYRYYPFVPLHDTTLFHPYAKDIANNKIYCSFCNAVVKHSNLNNHLQSDKHSRYESPDYRDWFLRTRYETINNPEWIQFVNDFHLGVSRLRNFDTYIGFEDMVARMHLQ